MVDTFIEHRNRERTELLSYAKNLINTFVFGEHGIGKTTLISEVVQEI